MGVVVEYFMTSKRLGLL